MVFSSVRSSSLAVSQCTSLVTAIFSGKESILLPFVTCLLLILSDAPHFSSGVEDEQAMLIHHFNITWLLQTSVMLSSCSCASLQNCSLTAYWADQCLFPCHFFLVGEQSKRSLQQGSKHNLLLTENKMPSLKSSRWNKRRLLIAEVRVDW